MLLGKLLGLRPSLEPLLGGVKRLPTLVRVLEVGMECAELTCEYVGYFTGGGGSSNVGRCEALGLRAVKLAGAPIWSGPETIEGGNATAAATLAVGSSNGSNGWVQSAGGVGRG